MKRVSTITIIIEHDTTWDTADCNEVLLDTIEKEVPHARVVGFIAAGEFVYMNQQSQDGSWPTVEKTYRS